jgi:hypothetical protein
MAEGEEFGHKVYFSQTRNMRLRDPYSNPYKSQAVGFFTTLFASLMAEGEGFEPSNRLPRCYLSKVVH